MNMNMNRNMAMPRGRRGLRGTVPAPMAMPHGPTPTGRGPGSLQLGIDPGMAGLSNPMPSRQSGTMMTQHYQLQELDLELALLKRKREMIEEQQHQLASDRYARPSVYDCPQSHLPYCPQQYNDPRLSQPPRDYAAYYPDRQHGSKRQASDGAWQSGSAPKRSAAPSTLTTLRYGDSGSRPRQETLPQPMPMPICHRAAPRERQYPSQPTPLMANWQNPSPVPRDPNFNPTRVIRTRPMRRPNSGQSGQATPPNRLNSYPVAERRTLVVQATPLARSTDPRDWVLHADRVPSRQLTGRLELALGTILKLVKELHGDRQPPLDLSALRAIKRAVRDRIRSVMLGREVGHLPEIMKVYRQKFPLETDIQLLEVGLEVLRKNPPPVRQLAVKLIESENPSKFFKANFYRLLHQKLDDMFEHIRKLYKTDEKTVHDWMDIIIAEEEHLLRDIIEKKDTDTPAETETDVITVDDSEINAKDEKPDETKPCDVKPEIKEEVSVDDTVTADTKPVTEADEPITEKKDAPVIDLSEIDEACATETERDDWMPNTATETFKASVYNKIIDTLLKRKLPKFLPMLRERIIQDVLLNDETYKSTLAYIALSAKRRVDQIVSQKKMTGQSKQLKEMTSDALDQNVLPATDPMHYVKVIGQPTLPKRKLMQAFLNQFHPTSIKKHRTIHNLLFLGFADRLDYDNIQAANNAVVGNSIIEVKVSDRTLIKEPVIPPPVDDNDEIVMVEGNDDSPVVIQDDDASLKFDPELDHQITDLLASVRNEDENNTVKQITDEVTAEGEEVATEAMESYQNGDDETGPNEEVIENGGNTDVKSEEQKNGVEAAEIETEATENETEDANVEEPANNAEEPANNDEEPVKSDAEPTKNEAEPANDVEAVKNDAKETVKGTATRVSARVANATPNTIRTRRASRLAQNN